MAPHKSEGLFIKSEIIENQTNALVIIFNKESNNTEFINRSTSTKESFQFWREGFKYPFDDPNLHISVFHGLEKDKIKITRKELEEMNVWFDSEMDYMDWFNLDYDQYYIIFQDEYLVRGSLDPNYEFTAYEVKISTGGIE